MCFVFTNFICSLLVGLLSALFSYWLNNRNKKLLSPQKKPQRIRPLWGFRVFRVHLFAIKL
ncbi:type I toxin-antitoxin system Fst family toxin [Enterococcus avium]